MPEDMPDKMPEDVSERMPEDLPVTKRIDVMVGITRLEVKYFLQKHVFFLHIYIYGMILHIDQRVTMWDHMWLYTPLRLNCAFT